MKIFTSLYDRAMLWAAHPHAPRYLVALSFAESSFFPVPPDVMLAPMVIAESSKGLWFALITTIASVIGGLAGYLIGMFAFDMISPWLQTTHYWADYLIAQEWFDKWGIWVIFVAGFSPIPYKLFTITAGALALAVAPFLIASMIGRGARFFLVAIVLMWLGPRMQPILRKYIEWIGWLMVVLLLGLIIWARF